MAFPSSPSDGQLAVVNNITYAYSAATKTWTRQQHFFNSTGPIPPTTNLLIGDTWYNTSDDTLYRYTYDGTNYYWVDIITPTVSSNVSALTSSNITASSVNVNSINVSSNVVTSNVYASNYFYANGTSIFSTKYLSVLLNSGTTTSVGSYNGYITVTMYNGSGSQIPVN